MKIPHQLLDKFSSRFGAKPRIYRAPGRVNLIGEHTDYNEGFVLPSAIELFCWVAAAPRTDRMLVVYSENFDEAIEASLDSLSPMGKGHWANYPLGVAWILGRMGHRLQGANIYVRGEIPIGAGLSSSAAIEVAVGFALLKESGLEVDRTELAKECQMAENDFVGARCGIMDQFISCHGHAAHALMLDCRSLEYKLVRLPEEIRLVICNTMVKHELGSNEYNSCRAACEEGVRKLGTVLPGIRSLRDVTLSQLEEHRQLLEPMTFSRCRHVITENQRVQEAAKALKMGNIKALGPLMQQSHRSLREDYQVSCKELDLMTEIALVQPGVIGARMTGGGFGGCTINLVESAGVDGFMRNVAAEYSARTGLSPEIYASQASGGVQQVVVE